MIGFACLLIGLVSMPWMVIIPTKVAGMINTGNILILASFAVMYGPKVFFIDKFLCNGWRSFWAIMYILALGLSIYFGFFTKKDLITVICLLAELLFMLYFVAQNFPGGISGVNTMFKYMFLAVKGCC